MEAAYARSDLFQRRRVLMDDWARYLVQRSGEDLEPLANGGPGDRLPGASQGESQARSAAAVKARMSRTTRVQVFSTSSFPQGSLWRERPSEAGEKDEYQHEYRSPVPCRTRGGKEGGRSLHFPPRAARSPPGGRGPRGARPGLPLLLRTRKTPVPCGFPGNAQTTAARALPSEIKTISS